MTCQNLFVHKIIGAKLERAIESLNFTDTSNKFRFSSNFFSELLLNLS